MTDLSFDFDKPLSKQEIAAYLAIEDDAQIKVIQEYAEKTLLKECGNKVHFRALVEVSNICHLDCYYCGIRKHNKTPERYQMNAEDVIALAKQAKDLNYASFVIQTGERNDAAFVDYIENILKGIKEATRCDKLPNGLGITLSIGEQSKETYQRFYDAGAHRYLLRIETSNPELFAKLHPPEQTLESRLTALKHLRDVGFQVGTGVMIGLPGQTLEDLANDIWLFKELDVDMIGMGPFIPDPGAYAVGGMDESEECLPAEVRVRRAHLMIAMTRIVLRDVNIAATTALQALDPLAREKALRFGANIMMPLMTPRSMKKNYKLYPKQSLFDEASLSFHQELEKRIQAQGREIGYGEWGDSAHAKKRSH